MQPSLIQSLAVAGLAALASTGCMSPAVFDYHGDEPPPRAAEPLPVSLAINDLAIPNTRMEVVGPQQATSARYGDLRFVALEERLSELLTESGMARDVRRSRDLSREGIGAPGFVVQYRVQSYSSSSSDDPGGIAAFVVMCVVTAGLGALAVMPAITKRHEHAFQVEARLYRVEDSQLVSMSAPGTGERIAQYDTAGAELVARATRQLTIRSGHCASCTPGAADAESFHREEGRQMARVVFDETAPELLERMRASFAARPAMHAATHEVLSTAGGESPTDFPSAVRARLDERAAMILLCANREAAAVSVEWAQAGRADVRLRDAGEDEADCVRSAVGELSAPSGIPAGRVLHVISH